MTKKKGANNAPQTENQAAENNQDGAISITTPELEQLAGPVIPQGATVEPIVVDLTPEAPERHIDEELTEEQKVQSANEAFLLGSEEGITGEDESAADELSTESAGEEAPLLTDEQILEKVAEAAFTESGHSGWQELSEAEKKDIVKIAKYFRDNPEAHADQFHSTIKAEKGLKDYYDYPEQEREQAEAFAASVKNAYRA